MSYTFELNSERKDANYVSGKINKKSPVVEVFSAMTDGKDLSKFGAKADVASKYIMELSEASQTAQQITDLIKSGEMLAEDVDEFVDKFKK